MVASVPEPPGRFKEGPPAAAQVCTRLRPGGRPARSARRGATDRPQMSSRPIAPVPASFGFATAVPTHGCAADRHLPGCHAGCTGPSTRGSIRGATGVHAPAAVPEARPERGRPGRRAPAVDGRDLAGQRSRCTGRSSWAKSPPGVRPGMGSRTWNGHRPVPFVGNGQLSNSVSSRAVKILVCCTFFRCSR